MRSMISAVLAAGLLLATPVFAAADSQDQGSLAPGTAAGVQQAQDLSIPLILSIVGVVAVGVGVAILVSNSHHNSATKTTPASP